MFSNASHKELKDSVNSVATPLAIFEHATSGGFQVVTCNELFTEVVDEALSLINGKPIDDIFPRYLANQISHGCNESIRRQSSEELEVTINRLGTNRWWKCLITPLVQKFEDRTRLMITLIEVTEKKILSKELAKANSRFKAIVTSAYDGIVSIDINGNILLANEAAQEIFGSGGLVGKHINTLIPQKFRHKHSDYVQSFRTSDVPSRPMHLRASVMGLKSNGQEVPLEVTIARINVEGDTEMTAIIRDITEKNELIDELNQISTTDSLTSLYNRRYLESMLSKEFERAKRYNKTMSLLFIDVDNFKSFNDNYGHAVGDAVLKKVASTIKMELRDIDTACRWGGEEFVILSPEIASEEASLLAERLRSAVEDMQCNYHGLNHNVTVSVGVCQLNDSHKLPEELIRDSDETMLKAKKQGRNKVVMYE
ncbi:diguanylate cyclase [Aliiglaciecola sp.]|nr:diguanylate cyclase [Aliiglaciecola sp.]